MRKYTHLEADHGERLSCRILEGVGPNDATDALRRSGSGASQVEVGRTDPERCSFDAGERERHRRGAVARDLELVESLRRGVGQLCAGDGLVECGGGFDREENQSATLWSVLGTYLRGETLGLASLQLLRTRAQLSP